MASVNHKNHAELVALFAKASSRMHASLDIPSILREAVSTCMLMVGAEEGVSGLFLENHMAFSEYLEKDCWRPMQCSFDEASWLGDMIGSKQSCIVEPTSLKSESHHSECFEVEKLLAVPVVSEAGALLACLLVFNHGHLDFSEQDIQLVEHLAKVMASAIENSIRYAGSRRAEEDLEKSVATYRTLVEQIPAITYISTVDRSQVIFVSPQVEGMLGDTQADFLANQKIWLERIHADDRERVIREVQESLDDGVAFHSEYRVCKKSGNYIWVKDAADVVRDHGEELYLQGVLYDISERKATEQEMMRLAHFDQITGLANRSLFLDRLTQSVAYAKRNTEKFAVMFLDLDGFKSVNDSFGHQAGDELLAEVASRLNSHVREIDTVARMGGDEFTVILTGVHSQKGIELVAKKLIASIAEPYAHIEKTCPVTLSMGVAVFPDDSEISDELVRMADDAMYRAKNSGKNCYCFTSDVA